MITNLRRQLAEVRRGLQKASQGFTLVELMITLALVAILVAVTLPSMSRTMERIDSRSTARTLANVFRQARDQAMSRGEVMLVEIEPNTNHGQLTMYRTNTRELRCNGVDTGDVTQVGDTTTVDQLSSDMEIRGVAQSSAGGSPDWLCFSPEGTVHDPGGDVIQHANCENENFRMWIADRNAVLADAASTANTTEADMTGCPSAGSSWSEAERREVRNGRYLASLWVIDVPFNGAIRADQ